jgi:hypothetical protein
VGVAVAGDFLMRLRSPIPCCRASLAPVALHFGGGTALTGVDHLQH